MVGLFTSDWDAPMFPLKLECTPLDVSIRHLTLVVLSASRVSGSSGMSRRYLNMWTSYCSRINLEL